MTNYHFKYEGEVVISTETQEEAEEQLKHILRGVFSYRPIHHSVGMLSEQLYEDEEFSDPCPDYGYDDGWTEGVESVRSGILGD